MRLLFITYCMGVGPGGAQIGSYKRGLRVALEMAGRGHEIVFFCTGRQFYHDSLTAGAETRLQFVEFPFQTPDLEGARRNRETFLNQLAQIAPDVVVIGDAPLAGTLLETTLSAVERRIPVVMLDNTYQSGLVDNFCVRHGAMFDSVILSGPSVLHGRTRYRYLLQVPPYVDVEPDVAQQLVVDKFGSDRSHLMVVLGYDHNVERLGLSLTRHLADDPQFGALFITPNVSALRKNVSEMPLDISERITLLRPPEDPILFGLLQAARLAVTKGGFMQVTETLTLGTPVIGFWYEPDYPLAQLPAELRAFTHPTLEAEADDATVAAARGYLASLQGVRGVHTGGLGAAAKAADFIEAMSPQPRSDTEPEAAHLGFPERKVRKAIGRLEPGRTPIIRQIRASHLRSFEDYELFTVVCEYQVNGRRAFARLWGRIYQHTLPSLRRNLRSAPETQHRVVLYASGRLVLELDVGEGFLPGPKEAAAAMSARRPVRARVRP